MSVATTQDCVLVGTGGTGGGGGVQRIGYAGGMFLHKPKKRNKKRPSPSCLQCPWPWGREILGKLSEALFSRRCVEKRAAASGTKWSTLVEWECLFQCTSVAIARGNMMALRTLRQGWQQQPSSSTKAASRTVQHSRPDCGMSHHSWHCTYNWFLIGSTTRDQQKV